MRFVEPVVLYWIRPVTTEVQYHKRRLSSHLSRVDDDYKTAPTKRKDMTVLVPFDGSKLSRTALKRAETFADSRDEELVALTVLPDDQAFAVERGWISSPEEYDISALATRFEEQVTAIAEKATFRHETPDDTEVLTATATDDITRTIRQVAAELDVSVIFIGTENAGRISTPVTSVGSPLSKDPAYDVHIVRHAESV